MVLSRFWLVIFISSLLFVVISLFSGNSYTIDHVLNGKKDDPVLVSEKYLQDLPAFIKDSIEKAPDMTMVLNRDAVNPDTTYVFKNKTVKNEKKNLLIFISPTIATKKEVIENISNEKSNEHKKLNGEFKYYKEKGKEIESKEKDQPVKAEENATDDAKNEQKEVK